MALIVPQRGRMALVGLAVVVATAFGWVEGASKNEAKHAAAALKRSQAETKAIMERIASNKAIQEKHANANASITKANDETIARLTARIIDSERLRVGPSLCGGPSSPADLQGTASSNSASTPGRLVSEAADRDLKQLIVEVEADLATARACQAALREANAMP